MNFILGLCHIYSGKVVTFQESFFTILPADKGRATVILNTTDYETKMATLLNDPTTYEPLAKELTAPYKRKLINIIKRWQSQDPIPQQLKHRIYPTAEEVPKICGLPKIHKPDFPLRPIVASMGGGGITYNAARVLADILSPLVGQSERRVKNSSSLIIVDKIQDLEVPPGQKLISYDVTALFTSIPVPDAIKAVQLKLSADDTLSERTSLSIDKILELFKLCLDTTFFVYKNQIIINRRGVQFRYMDDTFTKIHEYYVEEFTRHINSIDPNIIFTTEPESSGVLPFLDTCEHINDDGRNSCHRVQKTNPHRPVLELQI